MVFEVSGPGVTRFGVFEVRGFDFGVLEVRGFLFGFSRFHVPGLRGSGFRVRSFSRFLGSAFQGCHFAFLRFGVSGSGFRVRAFAIRASGGSAFLRFEVWGSWLGVSRFRGFGFVVSWFGVFEFRGFVSFEVWG